MGTNYQRFYKQLFQPIEERIGRVDEASIMAIIGFDCGGPVTLCTVGRGRDQFVSYVTCELSVRDEQKPAEFGRYEIMMTCDDERWAHKILTKLGQMSLESVFAHGHTVDIRPVVGPDCPVQLGRRGVCSRHCGRAALWDTLLSRSHSLGVGVCYGVWHR
jgi:hypothetical protein